MGRERPALYRDAFQKILRLHVEKLLTQEGSKEDDQTSFNIVKGTEEISSGSALTNSVTDAKPLSLEEQGDEESSFDNVSEASGNENTTDEDEERDTDYNQRLLRFGSFIKLLDRPSKIPDLRTIGLQI